MISEVLRIRELTSALHYGLNKVRIPAPVPVGAKIRATASLISAQQKTLGVESVFGLTFEIGRQRPACTADVILLYPSARRCFSIMAHMPECREVLG